MKKVYLIAHDSLRSQLIDSLHEQGLLHITNLREEMPEQELPQAEAEYESALREADLAISKAEFVLNFLVGFEEEKKGFLAGMIKEKIVVEKERFYRIKEKVDFEEVYRECEELDVKLTSIDNRLSHLSQLRASLEPWLPLRIRFDEVKETRRTVLFLGEVSTPGFAKFRSELAEEVPESSLEEISRDFRFTRFLLIFLKERSEEVQGLLQRHGFRQVTFPGLEATPRSEIEAVDKECARLEREREETIGRARELSHLKPDLLILRDFLEDRRKKIEVQANFARTREVFMLEGWTRETDAPAVRDRAMVISREVDVTFVDPTEEDRPPIILENKKWLKPFEIVTRLYGLPRYGELDPTPHLALFFTVFFGICVGDVGYGLLLILLSWWLRRKLPVSETVKRFFVLLIYGGFAAMVAGALTGSWFCVPTESLPPILARMMVVEPLKEPIIYLIFCFALGFLHLLFGVVLEAYEYVKQSRWMDAIFKEGSKLIFLPGAALLIVRLLSGGKGEPPVWLPVAKWMAIVGAVLIVLFHNRENKNILARIGGGIYGLYGMTSFIGDTISYCRLMALGLATFLIGWAINIMGQLTLSIPYVGFVGMIVILVVGHLFNLAINLISAFVHPARLQYVEFFTKFFEGGGRKFQPFAIETKNLVFRGSATGR
ncbi:MAG TPA: hypothetical protein DCW86_01140 [Actinobacteria bacterium]|nr:hypothetical protein [Actinomycetota bacterium]